METILQAAAHVSLFLCAVIFSAWFGGVRPGLLAMALSVLAFDYYFLPPTYSLAVEITQLPRLLLFALLAFFVLSLSAAQKSATESLKQAHDDLKRNNKALQAEIVERKRLEDELRQREASLRNAQRIAHIGCWDWDIQNDQFFGSEEYYRIIGLTKEEFGGNQEAVYSTIHPDDRAIFKAAVDAALANVAPFNMVNRVLRPSGEVRIVHGIDEVTFDESGKPLRMSGTVQDITERKRAEEALRESQQLLHLVLATLPVGVAVTDRAGDIVLVNAASKRIWGGMIVSGRERWAQTKGSWHDSGKRITPANWASVRALSEGQTSLNELIDVETYDGQQKTIQNSAAPIRNAEGLIVGAVFINEDVTERVRAEKALRESQLRLQLLSHQLLQLQETERRHIARELHDEIGQSLTGIKLALETSAREQAGNTKPILAEAVALANELIGRVRDLSLELRPAMLDDLGLLAVLRWHFERYTARFKIKVDFKHSGLEGHRFPAEIETTAYRIVQEALTNVARHAGVDQVEVNVTADKSAIRMRIKDRGAGFDPDSRPSGITGGLSGMHERAIMLGGKFKVESTPGAGSLLTAELPLRQQ
jgi:PAS domain S-box-containing protein